MADAYQVEAAIVSYLGLFFYPNGTTQASTVGATVNIERGWPTEADIQQAVSKNIVMVRVLAIQRLSRDVTRYPRQWQDQPEPVLTLTATLVGYVITFSGIPAVGQFIGVTSHGIGYAYPVSNSDNLNSIATNVANLISGASSAGATITLPNSNALPEVAIQQGGNSQVETARIMQNFCLAFWCPSPALRDSSVALAEAGLTYVYRLNLADGSIATLCDIMSTGEDDVTGRSGEWLREINLVYDFPVEYVTLVPPVTVARLTIAEQPASPLLLNANGNPILDANGNFILTGTNPVPPTELYSVEE